MKLLSLLVGKDFWQIETWSQSWLGDLAWKWLLWSGYSFPLLSWWQDKYVNFCLLCQSRGMSLKTRSCEPLNEFCIEGNSLWASVLPWVLLRLEGFSPCLMWAMGWALRQKPELPDIQGAGTPEQVTPPALQLAESQRHTLHLSALLNCLARLHHYSVCLPSFDQIRLTKGFH